MNIIARLKKWLNRPFLEADPYGCSAQAWEQAMDDWRYRRHEMPCSRRAFTTPDVEASRLRTEFMRRVFALRQQGKGYHEALQQANQEMLAR